VQGARLTITLQEAAAEDVPVLRRLMQLYLYDLGTIDGWDVGPDGLFGNAERVERYWSEDGRRSFLIRADGALAGFVLVRDEAWFAGRGTSEISEFFVMRKYRRRGVGEQAARVAFDMFSGRWEVAEMASNTAAQAFWRAVIGRYTGGRFEEAERSIGTWRGRVQHFHAPPRR
jgi:predicted acetyltransferase